MDDVGGRMRWILLLLLLLMLSFYFYVLQWRGPY